MWCFVGSVCNCDSEKPKASRRTAKCVQRLGKEQVVVTPFVVYNVWLVVVSLYLTIKTNKDFTLYDILTVLMKWAGG